MLGVIDDIAVVLAKIAHSIANHLKIFVERSVKNIRYLKIPRFSENNHVFSLSAQKTLKIRVLSARRILSASRAECDKFCSFQLKFLCLLEELHVFRVASRVSRLDKSHPKLVQSLHNVDFVLNRITDALALRAISQSRIKNRNLLFSVPCFFQSNPLFDITASSA